MPRFKTLDLTVTRTSMGTYNVRNKNGTFSTLHGRVDVVGEWRSRPKGKRLFTPSKVRAIRDLHSQGKSLKTIAEKYDCSRTLVYHIAHGSLYRDVR